MMLKMKIKDIHSVEISNDNKYLAAATTSKVLLFKFPSLILITQFVEIKHPSYLKFSSDNKLLAIKSTLGEIGLFNLKNYSFLRKFKYVKDAGDGSNISFTPDNQFIIDGDWCGNVRLLNIEDGIIKVIEKNENIMIKNIEYDDTNKIFHIYKFYRGGASVTDSSYRVVSRWKYSIEQKDLVFLDKTNKLSKSGNLLFDKVKMQYVTTERNSQQQLEIVAYNYMLETMIFRRTVEGIVKNNYTKESISSNGAFIGITFDSKVQIYSTVEFIMEKELNLELPNRIYFTNDSKYLCLTNINGNLYIYSLTIKIEDYPIKNTSIKSLNYHYVNLLKNNFSIETIKQIPNDELTEVIKDYVINEPNKSEDEFKNEVTEVFWQTWWFECEEGEGGIYQYFLNNGDAESLNRLMISLSLIHAEKTLNLVKKVYIELLYKKFEEINWDAYQVLFDKVVENLETLRIKYVRNKTG